MIRLFLLCALGLPALATPPPKPPHPYADATRRRIATVQDERHSAAIIPFLVDKNDNYRAAATLALGSVQDTSDVVVAALVQMLVDKNVLVRRAAAFSLGQTRIRSVTDVLSQRLAQATDYQERKFLAEAIGRCISRTELPEFLQAVSFHATDTAWSTPVAWALYRASLRGLATPEVVRHAVALLAQPGAPLAARAGASAALTRMKGQDSTLAQVALPVLLKVVASDPNYFVRENCASALGRVARPVAYAALIKAAAKDADHRVRIAALRALPARFSLETAQIVEASLRSALPQESLTAAEWFLKLPADSSRSKGDLLPVVRRVQHWRARATLLQAALRHASKLQRPAIADTIRRRYAHTANQYEKAALLTALSEDPAQFDFLAQTAASLAGPPIVPGTALAALVSLRSNKNFPAARQADFAAALRGALAGGDVAQLSTAAEALASPALVPEPQPADLAALRQAQAKLALPREIEAWLGLQQALDKLTKAPQPTPAPVGPASQHPIDWALVQSIPVGQRVRFTTTKGTLVLELKVVEAPGSVASFVSLVRQHFYDGLYFHRVVPDFVAQGGDPRGDGSGSTPYTLRSEFAQLQYGAGAVGLASAGKDTESCQFFFTHQPTPHLDGRYTIFAQVVSGMDVVQRLEIGDKMLQVALIGTTK